MLAGSGLIALKEQDGWRALPRNCPAFMSY
jgi:hypothetical protein